MSVIPKQLPRRRRRAATAAALASAVAGAIQRAAQATGASFEYLLATAKVESNLNPNLDGADLVGDRAVPVHRADLARHDEEGRARRSASATMPTRSRATPSGRYQVADPQLRGEILQLRKDPAANAVMAGAFTQQQCRRARRSGSAARRPTASSTSRISSAPPAPAQADQCRAASSPQANAAAHVSGRGARQPLDLLRPAGQRAQRRRRLCRAQSPLPGRARQCDAERRADRHRCQRRSARGRRRRATPRAPDTAGTTNAFAVAAPRASRGRRRAGVPLAVPQWRRSADGRGAVAPIVAELWGAAPADAPAAATDSAPAVDRPGGRRRRLRRTGRSTCSGTCGRMCAACSGAATAPDACPSTRSRG